MTKAIKFYADWCGPCKAYSRIWNKVEEDFKHTDVEFTEINIDKDTSGLAAEYRVRSIPFTVIIKDEEVRKQVGVLDEDVLKELLIK